MKRRGRLIEQIADMENLRLAYWKAKRGKSAKKEVLAFAVPSLDENLLQLRSQLLGGMPEVGVYHYFKVFEPKERLVCAAPFTQRVLHHAMINVCHQDFERYQIFDSYACRRGKGTYAALNRAMGFQRQYRYCMKLDVRKFFDSIDHSILYMQIERLYKDPRLLNLFRVIIDSYHSTPGKGLPIGNLTSQYMANHYLSVLDHLAKEQLGAVAYVRYMDDIMVWDDNKTRLKEIGVQMRAFMREELGLEMKVFYLSPACRRMTFLGYQIAASGARLSKRSADRYRLRIRQLYHEYDCGAIDQKQMNMRLQPLLAFVCKVPSKGVRQKAMTQCV